jgi:hypothetical protein
LLAVGEVLGVLPQREPRALEILGDSDLTGAAGVVLDLAADFVQRVGGEHHDVKRVDATDGVGEPVGDRPGGVPGMAFEIGGGSPDLGP